MATKRESRDEEPVGPVAGPGQPTEQQSGKKKRRKRVLMGEANMLANLPSSPVYEASYMHRAQLSHTLVSEKLNFIITISINGHVRFWKKKESEIQFVKQFRAHRGAITAACLSPDGELLVTCGEDKVLRVFSVSGFDIINLIRTEVAMTDCTFVTKGAQQQPTVAVAVADSNEIRLYHVRGETNEAVCTFSKIHSRPVQWLEYNIPLNTVISVDEGNMVEYWDPSTGEHPKEGVSWTMKIDTDMYEFVQHKAKVTSLAISPNGKYWATTSKDGMIRVFQFASGKLIRKYNETLRVFAEAQEVEGHPCHMERASFIKRKGLEKALEKTVRPYPANNVVFDESSNFIIYGCTAGIKIVNLVTNRVSVMLGKPETRLRFVALSLYQGQPSKLNMGLLSSSAEDHTVISDPTLVCAALDSNRFYLFTRRTPKEGDVSGASRDVFNEKPSRAEAKMAMLDGGGVAKDGEEPVKGIQGSRVIIHTTMGDIALELYPEKCPKSCENFCTHAKNGYYNGHIFHRVIKGFMIQGGDPTGIGTGGQSIWGKEFEDELHPDLNHDEPFVLSMANCGPNTNGSQFFITTIPCQWLNGKHTVFGRVTSGREVVQLIERVRVSRTQKPHEDVKMVSFTVE